MEEKDLPIYSCNKIKGELVLTGKINDPKWEEAETIGLVDNDTGNRPIQLTEARLLYSDTTLYIAFYCEDDYIWGTFKEKNAPIYDEECVEVFLNPSCSRHQYYEINVSPLNTVFNACILSNRTITKCKEGFTGLTDFNPAIKTKVHVEGEFGNPGKGYYWSVEYAIPFIGLYGSENITPVKGDQWRMNLYRIDSPREGTTRLYSWSPTGRTEFHLPWKFGILQF